MHKGPWQCLGPLTDGVQGSQSLVVDCFSMYSSHALTHLQKVLHGETELHLISLRNTEGSDSPLMLDRVKGKCEEGGAGETCGEQDLTASGIKHDKKQVTQQVHCYASPAAQLLFTAITMTYSSLEPAQSRPQLCSHPQTRGSSDQ